jgi:hypothetical protein
MLPWLGLGTTPFEIGKKFLPEEGKSKYESEILTKKDIIYSPTTSIIKHKPYETYAPQIQFAPVTTYGYQGATYIIESPGAVSKKEQSMDVVSRPEQRGMWEVPTTVTQEPTAGITSGTNLPLLVGIAVVGVVAFAFIKKGGKR